MRESQFTTEILASLRACGAFAFKIPDMPFGKADAGGRMRFNTGKRFDIHAVYMGKPLAIENKIYKQFKGFGPNQLRDEQIDALNAYYEADGLPFVFLNIRIPPIKGVQKAENRLLIFDWPLRFHGKKEIEGREFIQGAKGLFDLQLWLDSLG